MTHDRLTVEADGGSRGNPGHAGYGAVVRDAQGAVLAERAGYLGVATNNVAEYSGLIAGLEAAVAIAPDAAIDVRMDSKLVVEQLSGRWAIKHADMKPLAARAREIIGDREVTFEWIPRERNSAADALANEAMDTRDREIVRGHGATGPSVGPEYDDPDPAPVINWRDSSRRDLVSTLSLVLVRHGVTDMTTSHLLSGGGVAGPPLNAAGRVQAAKAADAVYRVGRETWAPLAPVSRILASPMQRTQDTAGALGRRLGLHVEVDDRAREVNFGEWEGLSAPEAFALSGDLFHRWDDAEEKAPGGESLGDVVARMRPFMEDLAAEQARLCAEEDIPRTIAIVSHSVAIKSMVAAAMEMAPATVARIWPTPASLTILQLRVTPEGQMHNNHLLALGVPTS
ncbi:bifunctional RNase H/acid phosphatase [Demequina sp.]|uniref:bifunctional RNase H/acid phosphatase n=1 Tax=Demequina sp. TaxID=2050685 RepID=UPI003D0AD52D